jgi:hypothetical protein
MANRHDDAEPRWPVVLALGAVVGLQFSLPKILSFGPGWLLLAAFVVLAVMVFWFHSTGAEKKAHAVGFILLSSVTIALVSSLFLLVRSLPAHSVAPAELLRSAVYLWISNVLVFAAWYWKLDAGGPYARETARRHEDGAFLFPQMALGKESPAKPDSWRPRFIDYLFLAFNTSTALSPTDTQILSPWAKFLMMLQSLISLTIVALLAARAVNIL